jgi:hypothetical protein
LGSEKKCFEIICALSRAVSEWQNEEWVQYCLNSGSIAALADYALLATSTGVKLAEGAFF